VNLDPDCKLAYTIIDETYYRDAMKHQERPLLWVSSSCEDTSIDWQFNVEEYTFDWGRSLQLTMHPSACKAIVQVPELFAALAEQEPKTLSEMVAILDRLGAVDVTERDEPVKGSRHAGR
jgi:hypothetical protein